MPFQTFSRLSTAKLSAGLIGGLSVGLLSCLLGSLLGCEGSTKSERGPNGFFSTSDPMQDYGSFDDAKEAQLTPQQKSGRAVWYNATAGDARFHEYSFAQRLAGKKIDWFKFFNARERAQRFNNWGLINDPDCCVPGDDCKRKFNIEITLDQTYGVDYCKGDEKLYPFIGQASVGGKTWADNFDPACFHQDVGPNVGQKENSCHLEFGQPLGAVGFRKFPNPRFNRKKWLALNGSPANWDKYRARLDDFSTESPFLVGVSCASCHVGFDPAHPPKNPNDPSWGNISGTIGSQYTRIGEIFASGFEHNSLERALFGQSRPGSVDTSGVPTDYINNPGTANAILNFDKRPGFTEVVNAWRPTVSCASPATVDSGCWCEPGKPGKCWLKSTKTEKNTRHILKGGEDSVGFAGALQRVYINIGSCSEQCWANHLADYRSFNPVNRNFAQTPFEIGQCRRDCPQFRAIEDRVNDVVSFIATRRTTDLVDAMSEATKTEPIVNAQGQKTQIHDENDLEAYLEKRFSGSIARGEQVFKQECARCHSSQTRNPADFAETRASDYDNVNLLATDANGVRVDWLGNDKSTPFDVVKTFSCRALHTNHLKGHIWDEYASDTYHNRPSVGGVGGGRGYMRNVSLLNLWMQAPLLHNNSVGPEMCPPGQRYPMNLATYSVPERAPTCEPFDPSVAARLRVYELSMRELLTPSQNRNLKRPLTKEDIIFPLGGDIPNPKTGKIGQIALRIPAGANINQLGNFDFKGFSSELITALENRDLKGQMVKQFGASLGEQVYDNMQAFIKSAKAEIFSGSSTVTLPLDQMEIFTQAFSTCHEIYDNRGHDFGTALSSQDKQSLMAFMALF